MSSAIASTRPADSTNEAGVTRITAPTPTVFSTLAV